MQLAASHQVPGDVGRLAAPRVRSVNGPKIAGDRDENLLHYV